MNPAIIKRVEDFLENQDGMVRLHEDEQARLKGELVLFLEKSESLKKNYETLAKEEAEKWLMAVKQIDKEVIRESSFEAFISKMKIHLIVGPERAIEFFEIARGKSDERTSSLQIRPRSIGDDTV
jgi:hypothetical protein